MRAGCKEVKILEQPPDLRPEHGGLCLLKVGEEERGCQLEVLHRPQELREAAQVTVELRQQPVPPLQHPHHHLHQSEVSTEVT